MNTLLISNVRESKGLYKDAIVFSRVLKEFGHESKIIDFRDEEFGYYDLAIHLEVVEPRFFVCAARHWWVPNPEWARMPYFDHIDRFDKVLCKTKDAERIFQPLTPNTVFTGFMSEDHRDRTKREPAFFHARRGSEAKGTDAVVESCIGLGVTLVCADGLDEAQLWHEQNRCLFHLCPSEYEGWGHSIHEGLSCGAIVVSTDLPPMNEFKGVAKLIPVASKGSRGLAEMGFVNTDGVRAAIEWCQSLKRKEIKQLTTAARNAYEEESDGFKYAIGILLADAKRQVVVPEVHTEIPTYQIETPVTESGEIAPREPVTCKVNTVSVIVATYGENKEEWDTLAERAMESVRKQSRPPDELIRVHGNTLAEARNQGVKQATGEWIIILDADDELEPYYIDSMLVGKGTLRFPWLQFDDKRVWKPAKDKLSNGNFMCIGTMFQRELFLKIGGFLDEPILEDWSLWLRMERAGGVPEPTFATYIVHTRPDSRNQKNDLYAQWTNIIRQRFG